MQTGTLAGEHSLQADGQRATLQEKRYRRTGMHRSLRVDAHLAAPGSIVAYDVSPERTTAANWKTNPIHAIDVSPDSRFVLTAGPNGPPEESM